MKILFAPTDQLTPIVKLAHDSGFQISTYHQNYAKVLTDMDIPCENISMIQLGEVAEQIFLSSGKLVHSLNSIKFSTNGKSETKYLKGVNGRVQAYVYPKLQELVSLVHALDISSPDMVVLHNDVEITTRLIAMWAKARRVPAVHVPHAVYVDIFNAPGSDIHDVFSASHLVVSGDYQGAWFRERGWKDQIAMTGLPQFDKWHGMVIDRIRAKKVLKLDEVRPVITYASSWRQDTHLLGCHDGVEETYVTFLKAIRRLDGAQLIVKIHPNASDANLKWHISKAEEIGVECVMTGLHLPFVLQASDLVFAYGPSNLLMEASYFPHVRLMTTHGFENDSEVANVGESVAPSVLAKVIAQSLSMPVPDKTMFRNKYCGPFMDGGNHKRVFSYMMQVLGLDKPPIQENVQEDSQEVVQEVVSA